MDDHLYIVYYNGWAQILNSDTRKMSSYLVIFLWVQIYKLDTVYQREKIYKFYINCMLNSISCIDQLGCIYATENLHTFYN